MIKSMTGFGRGEAGQDGYHLMVEMKAVNHRFLETVVKLPRSLNSFEEKVRKIIQAEVQRGRIEVFVNLMEGQAGKRIVKVDKDIALSYDKTLRELASALHSGYETDVYRLAGLPEVITVEDPEPDLEKMWAACHQALTQALKELIHMRRIEGQKLWEDLTARISLLEQAIKQIGARSGSVVSDYQSRLNERITALLGEVPVDETRLANEVAVFADRASITEEVVRFSSHLLQCRQAFKSDEPVGRRIDFLLQELNREINTIGSKANDLEITQVVVTVKSELEKIREQVQNIE